MRGGQEQQDRSDDTPATEASEQSNDMQVSREGPPDSGSGGVYSTMEVPSAQVADSRGCVVGPDRSS